MGALPQIGVVGAGMIMEDQNGPALAQMVCRGELGRVHIAAQGSASLRKLLGLPWWTERFPALPQGWVTTYPPRETDPAVRRGDFYRAMYEALGHRGDPASYRDEARWSRRWMGERFDAEAFEARRDGIIERGSTQQGGPSRGGSVG